MKPYPRIKLDGYQEISGKDWIAEEKWPKLRWLIVSDKRHVAEYQANHPDEVLHLKGYMLDQGSRPTHKRIIINLYEQGIDPTDISQRTHHGLDSVDRYIKNYERVKGLYRKSMSAAEIQKMTGMKPKVVNAYLTLAKHFHPLRQSDSNILNDKQKDE